jgi:hypothetical protein
VLSGFRGDADVVIELSTSVGWRRLRLGEGYRVMRSVALNAELEALLGHAILREGAEAPRKEALGAA